MVYRTMLTQASSRITLSQPRARSTQAGEGSLGPVYRAYPFSMHQ